MVNESPMSTMAASARDRLQASARELMRNFEEVMSTTKREQSPPSSGSESAIQNNTSSSFENAFRLMFGACTSPGADATPPESIALQESSSSDPSRGGGGGGGRRRHLRRASSGAHYAKSSPAVSKAAAVTPPVGAEREFGEHIYAQLFFDDQIRAARAVNALRGHDSKPGAAVGREASGSAFPKGFKVSSPERMAAVLVGPSGERPPPPPLSSEELRIPATATFDDGISAISAHTLENMARNILFQKQQQQQKQRDSTPQSRSRSNESSLFPPSSPSNSVREDNKWGAAAVGASRTSTPLSSSRSRSGRDGGDPGQPAKLNRIDSTTTRTTSESSDFEQMWHQEEKRYWNGLVRREDGKDGGPQGRKGGSSSTPLRKSPSRGRRHSNGDQNRKSMHDLTLSTASSSAYSTWSSHFDRHPHETFHYSPGDLFPDRSRSREYDYGDELVAIELAPFGEPTVRNAVRNDPCRIKEVLDVPSDAEMMEI